MTGNYASLHKLRQYASEVIQLDKRMFKTDKTVRKWRVVEQSRTVLLIVSKQ